MRKIICLLAMLFWSQLSFAAGTCSITDNPDGVFWELVFTWTSDASGDVDDSSCQCGFTGQVQGVEFESSGTATPTALYDVKLNDAADNDLLRGAGANIAEYDTADEDQDTWYRSMLNIDGSKLTLFNKLINLVVANAGNAKSGKVRIIYVK